MHTSTGDRATTKKDNARATHLLGILLSFVLAVSSLPLTEKNRAHALSNSDVPSTITLYRTVRDEAGWQFYYDDDNNVAYCASHGYVGPAYESAGGTLYDQGWKWADSTLSAIVYNGYPYTNTINGTAWSDYWARVITQQAVYMYLGYVNYDGSYDYYHYYYEEQQIGNISNELPTAQFAAVQALYSGAVNGTLTAPTNVVVVYNAVTRTINNTNYTSQTMIYCLNAGTIALQKASSNTDLTTGNSLYSLANAVYGVYTSRTDASNNSNAVTTITTDEDGFAETSVSLSPGTYYVREISAPTGYALDTTIYTVTVTNGNAAYVNNGTVYDTPQNGPAGILLQKVDSETGAAQGSASLEGAEYVVEYYDGYYDTAEKARASGNATRTWVFATDKNGFVYLDDGYLISSTSDGSIASDSLYYDSSGDATIPLGTVVVYEYTASAGYLVSDEIYVTQVTSNGAAEAARAYNAPTGDTALQEQVIRGGVEIYKTDAETDLSTPQGAASFDGTTFEVITLNENDVVVDGVTYSKNEVVATLIIENGYAATSADALPYGTYSIQEVSAGTGYLLDDTVYYFTIDMDGEIVTAGEADGHIHDQVIRGDIEFIKKDQATGTAMAGIPFRITSETTGESHIIVTDQNGYASTAASWNLHSYNTNGNDAASDGSYDASYGIWFGDISAVDDSLGALPYDTYTIEELACEANEGRQLVVQTGVVIIRNNMTVNLGTIDDPTAAIISEAVDGTDDDHTVVAGVSASIIDYVYYYNVVPNREYTLEGTLVLTDTGEEFAPNGSVVTASTTFTPTSTAGVVGVVFDLNETVSELPEDELNVTITVFEKLYCDGRLIASHEDVDDTLQQIQIVTPELTTHAFDADDEVQTLVVQTGTYDKTGTNFTFVLVVILALTFIGVITTAYGIRRLRKPARRSARKASRSGYRVFDPFLYENPNNDRYQRNI